MKKLLIFVIIGYVFLFFVTFVDLRPEKVKALEKDIEQFEVETYKDEKQLIKLEKRAAKLSPKEKKKVKNINKLEDLRVELNCLIVREVYNNEYYLLALEEFNALESESNFTPSYDFNVEKRILTIKLNFNYKSKKFTEALIEEPNDMITHQWNTMLEHACSISDILKKALKQHKITVVIEFNGYKDKHLTKIENGEIVFNAVEEQNEKAKEENSENSNEENIEENIQEDNPS